MTLVKESFLYFTQKGISVEFRGSKQLPAFFLVFGKYAIKNIFIKSTIFTYLYQKLEASVDTQVS